MSREVSITIDDLPATNSYSLTGHEIVKITTDILNVLSDRRLPSVGFVNEGKVFDYNDDDIYIRIKALKMWIDHGFELGNHTFSHVSLSRTGLERWQKDVIRGEILTKSLLSLKGMELRYFRYPFLDMGRDKDIRSAAERFLAQHGYRIVPATIDLADWMYADLYDDALRRDDRGLAKEIAADFLLYAMSALQHWEQLSLSAVGYEVKQIVLLHANKLIAHYLDELLNLFQERGYRFITLHETLNDPVYRLPSTYFGEVGTSWINHISFTRGQLAVSQISSVIPPWIIVRSNSALPHPKLPNR